MVEHRKVLINGHRVRLAGDHLSDSEVASNVRMLMRDEIDHEAVCITARDRIMWLSQEVERLRAALNTPEIDDFARGVVREAQHQRARWRSDHDAGKEHADWFWLIGYLVGKALTAANEGNSEKALHHTISSAAALANWHAAISGTNNEMRPGIDASAALPKESADG